MAGGGKQKTTTSSAPWEAQQPYLLKGFKAAGNLFDSGGFNQEYFPGQTVAGVTPATTQSWNMATNRATAGSPNLKAAQDYNLGILKGDFTALNPLLSRAQQGVNSAYAQAGRYGSGAHDAATTEALGKVITDAQGQAASLAPTLAQADYLDPQMLAQVGQQQQQQNQDLINAAIARWNFEQEAPIKGISDYMDLIQGQYGGTSTSSGPKQNPWLAAAGTGLGLLGSFL